MAGETVTERRGIQRTWVRVLLTALTVTVMTLIFFFSTEPAEQSDRTSGRIAMLVIHAVYPEYDRYPEKEQRKVYDDIQFLVRKAAHFTEYLVLGIMIRLCIESWFGKKRFLNTTGWVYGTLYACTDELHQLLTDGRSGQWQDVLLDSCGVLAGILITALIRRRRERKAGKSQCP